MNVIANVPAHHTLAHILNVAFEGLDMQHKLDDLKATIAFSAASACHATHLAPSHVLKAMGLSEAQAAASRRFSFGRFTTQEDIRRAIAYFQSVFRGA